MATLDLGNGHIALIDDIDLDAVHEVHFQNGIIWRGAVGSRLWRPAVKPHTTYAICLLTGSFELRLHRVIMDAQPNQLIDHIDGNGLNCVRSNLRVTTPAGNARNRRPNAGKTVKGVSWHRNSGKFSAQIRVNRKKIHLGLFLTQEEAQAAYDAAARKHFGEFAKPMLATI